MSFDSSFLIYKEPMKHLLKSVYTRYVIGSESQLASWRSGGRVGRWIYFELSSQLFLEEEEIYFSKQKHSVQPVVCLKTIISTNEEYSITVLKNM